MASVTVVVPCYKYGRYVTECVTSILANHEVDIDIHVIDDASPDDSWAVVERLPELDPRIRVQRNEQNLGLIGTANAGVLSAPGDYVILLSADDALAPGWLDRAVSVLESNPRAALAYGPTRRFADSLPTPRIRRALRPTYFTGRDWLQVCAGIGVTPVMSPAVIARTATHHAVGGYLPHLPHSSDMEMWLRLASAGDVVRIGGPVAAFYRVSMQSMSRAIYFDMLEELKVRRDAFDEWYGFADGRVPDRDELYATAKRALASRAVRRAYVAFLLDPAGSQFESLCAFALDNDPTGAARPIGKLRSLRDNRRAQWLRRGALPVTKMGVRARQAATDIRARLHVV